MTGIQRVNSCQLWLEESKKVPGRKCAHGLGGLQTIDGQWEGDVSAGSLVRLGRLRKPVGLMRRAVKEK